MYVYDYAAAYRIRRLGSHRSRGVKRAKHLDPAHAAAATGKESSCQLLENPSARAGKCASWCEFVVVLCVCVYVGVVVFGV